MKNPHVIGLDFGTDSVRALLVNAVTGTEIDTETAYYPRWKKGLYSNPSIAQFRHHPQDYLDCLKAVIGNISARHPDLKDNIVSIALDTTASTLCLTDETGTPLSLQSRYAENPNAMFVIWKDHTGQKEADEINDLLQKQPVNYAKYSGNYYSSECFWAKVLHLLRTDKDLQKDAWSAIELCDFIPAVLTGCKDAGKVRMGHCVAASKLMWDEDWGGYPPVDFFEKLDSVLLPIRNHLPEKNYGCERSAGTLTKEWAEILGLKEGIPVGVGNIDSHSGAVGSGIEHGTTIMNLGTSAGFMSVMTPEAMGTHIIDGIFGQVKGSILQGEIGFESGLSAFGDVFAWFKNLLAWPLKNMVAKEQPELAARLEDEILKEVSLEAEKLNITINSPLATDWFNGRRTPFPNLSLTGSITGMNLSTSAPEIYYSLAEATCFATKKVIDHLDRNGVTIHRLIGIGGIAQKSPFVMQMLSDTLGRTIDVSDCKQAGAMGSVIHATVVAGIYPSVPKAQKALCQPISKSYKPNAERGKLLERRYKRYESLGAFTESEQKKTY